MPIKHFYNAFYCTFFVFFYTSNCQPELSSSDNVFKYFIAASGDLLYNGNDKFRFISFNIPNLLTIEGNVPFKEKNYWHFPDQLEINDAFKK